MNDSMANATSISSVDISELIHTAYTGYVAMLVDCALLGLIIYTTVMAIPQEITYMWLSSKPFSIPNLLYTSTRYANLFNQAISFWLDFSPSNLSHCEVLNLERSLCNNLVYTQDAISILGYTGVQGLLIIRAYSLCQGNKVVTVILTVLFGVGLASNFYIIISAGGCVQLESSITFQLALVGNILIVLTDLIIFGVFLWKVWGTWKLKRETGILSHNDLVSVLFKQAISRFCFVITFTVTLTIIDQVSNNIVIDLMGDIQHSVSAILLADFMLDLRQKNSAVIQAADISLPTIQIQSVANYIHQSILVEVGDHETSVHTRDEDNDNLQQGLPALELETNLEESA